MDTNARITRSRPYGDGNLQIPDQPLQFGRTPVIIEMDALKTIDDYSVAGTEYLGWAICGASTASPLWRICRKTTVGSVETLEWADGDAKFDNIFDNRAALTYK